MSNHPSAYLVYQLTITIHVQFSIMSHEQSQGAVLPTNIVASDLAELSGLREQIFSKIFDSMTLRPSTNTVPHL